MLSICCGLAPVCVFGRGLCELQTDELRGGKNEKRGEESILVLDSGAVVRKRL